MRGKASTVRTACGNRRVARFGIADRGFWIGRLSNVKPKFQIFNPQSFYPPAAAGGFHLCKFISAFFLSLLFVFAAQAQTDCLNYEPENVTLNGKLVRLSIKNVSNQKETIYVLKLVAPICVKADAENEYNPAQNNIKDVQLVLDSEKYRSSRSLVNKNVIVSGTLFGEHTQHHFTKVLLTVSEIK